MRDHKAAALSQRIGLHMRSGRFRSADFVENLSHDFFLRRGAVDAHNQCLPALNEINAVSGAIINPEFRYAASDRLHVAPETQR